jgi:uncharacterized membrane protein required for colicin V production
MINLLEQLSPTFLPILAAAAPAATPPAAPPADAFTLVWFDVMVIILLGVGFYMGKKRGMSQELLDVLQWLLIVVVAALYYAPLSHMLAPAAGLGPLAANLISYIGIAIIIKIAFVLLKNAVGEKLVGSDIFGRMEYYFGMLAGMLRVFCMIIVAISLLNAEIVDFKKIEADKALQIKELGSTFFPTWLEIRRDILHKSIVGTQVRKHLADQLIAPVAGGPGGPVDREGGPGRRREKELDNLMGNGPAKK